ncbi:hypothetical protein L596_015626 [Steinernema carpocapsae]|uniref:Uncharacterized protein n=1 Tax=Steinernema carpocapsae TaxID=34508 RepID=A0A4U5NGI2_STECR|nr:hypothetical protein L596_015626 [Steinernema carpocapsae]
MPRQTAENPSLVVVAGEEDNVSRCVEYLRIDEEDFMQDVVESYGFVPTRTDSKRPLYDLWKRRREDKIHAILFVDVFSRICLFWIRKDFPLSNITI